MYELHQPEKAHKILRRLEFVHTPKHGGWLNITEIELSILSRQCLPDRIRDKDLRSKVKAWQSKRNKMNTHIDWQFTTEVRDSNNRLEWAKIVADLVESQYPSARKITLVQDNLRVHKPAAMYEVFEPTKAKAILDKI